MADRSAGARPQVAVSMKHLLITVFMLGLGPGLDAPPQDVPSELARLVAKARLDGPVAAWCRAEFRPGHSGAFAVAVTSPKGGGTYVALDADGRTMVLGSFTSTADLSCYSRSRAEELDVAIRQSETIHGHITPRWKTTVVCGFAEDTAAACWQYSPDERAFVKVGEWIT